MQACETTKKLYSYDSKKLKSAKSNLPLPLGILFDTFAGDFGDTGMEKAASRRLTFLRGCVGGGGLEKSKLRGAREFELEIELGTIERAEVGPVERGEVFEKKSSKSEWASVDPVLVRREPVAGVSADDVEMDSFDSEGTRTGEAVRE